MNEIVEDFLWVVLLVLGVWLAVLAALWVLDDTSGPGWLELNDGYPITCDNLVVNESSYDCDGALFYDEDVLAYHVAAP